MTLSVELFFDTYRERRNVYRDYVEGLISLTLVNKDSANEERRRPPHCLFVWGSEFPSFKGVIESLSTKYTMFLPNGMPVRATCNIRMKQAGKVKAKVRRRRAPVSPVR